MSEASIEQRISRVDWQRLAAELSERGYARISELLDTSECNGLIETFDREESFRSHVSMERHRYGAGDYKYFAYPLPRVVANLRKCLYPPLATIANDWATQLRMDDRYPSNLTEFVDRCHAQGQPRPTPLLLRYTNDGFNCLHQDRYGAIAFPLQITVLLSNPDSDFEGGEFLLVEQRPRQQSRGEAITLQRGEAILFPNQLRPVAGKQRIVRAAMRHGVSRIRTGQRFALGIIFHDAE